MKPAILLAAALLGGCSLSSRVQTTALDYSAVLEEFNNQGVLRNILRARDNAPLSFSDLPTIHGSMTLTAGLAASAPFGALHGSGARDAISPTIAFASNPSFDTTALNTRGFSALILQPVSPTFVASAWGTEIPRELLLRLFIASIDYAGDDGTRHTVYNNPADPSDLGIFTHLIHAALLAGLDLRSFTIFQPIGPTLDVAKAGKDALGAMTGVNETTFHLGNAPEGDRKLQLYRALSGQVIGCLNTAVFNQQAPDDYKLPLPAQAPAPEHAATPGRPPATAHITTLLADQLNANLLVTPGSGGAAAPAANPAASAANTAPLAAVSQISSVLDNIDCTRDPIVLQPATETQASAQTAKSIRIRWRSLEGAFRYVGALLRLNPQGGLSWTSIAHTGSLQSDTNDTQTLFTLLQNTPGRVMVDYRGQHFSLPDERHDAPNDHSLQVLALLTRLLNEDRLSAEIPVTQRLEVIP